MQSLIALEHEQASYFFLSCKGKSGVVLACMRACGAWGAKRGGGGESLGGAALHARVTTLWDVL